MRKWKLVAIWVVSKIRVPFGTANSMPQNTAFSPQFCEQPIFLETIWGLLEGEGNLKPLRSHTVS